MPDDMISAQHAIETALYTASADRILRALDRVRSAAKTPRIVSMLLRLLENAEDARVRNAAAVALAELGVKRAGVAIKAPLADRRTKGRRGTLLYALHALRVKINAADWARLSVEDSAETREECLLKMEAGLVAADEASRRRAARHLRWARRRQPAAAAAIEDALPLLEGSAGCARTRRAAPRVLVHLEEGEAGHLLAGGDAGVAQHMRVVPNLAGDAGVRPRLSSCPAGLHLHDVRPRFTSVQVIKSFRHKALAELFSTGRGGRIRPDLRRRILRRLGALDAAASALELDQPGFDFHRLHGFDPPRYTIHVNGPWCITFEWEDDGPSRIDLEQYH